MLRACQFIKDCSLCGNDSGSANWCPDINCCPGECTGKVKHHWSHSNWSWGFMTTWPAAGKMLHLKAQIQTSWWMEKSQNKLCWPIKLLRYLKTYHIWKFWPSGGARWNIRGLPMSFRKHRKCHDTSDKIWPDTQGRKSHCPKLRGQVGALHLFTGWWDPPTPVCGGHNKKARQREGSEQGGWATEEKAEMTRNKGQDTTEWRKRESI